MKGTPAIENHDSRRRALATAMLFLSALLWGIAFIPQKLAADRMTPFAFNGWRYLIAGISIFALARFRFPKRRQEIIGIVINGTIIFAAATLQQIGIAMTTVRNAGFITTLYVILVPFLSALFLRTKLTRNILIAAALALIGLYLLATGGRGLEKFTLGDLIVFGGAVFWAVQMLTTKIYIHDMDPFVFSAGQFFVCALLNLASWLIFDHAAIAPVRGNIPLLVFSGLAGVAAGFTLQALGIKRANPAHAANILSLEAVFAMIAGILILHEKSEPIQLLGAGLIFSAAALSASPDTEVRAANPLRPNEPIERESS